MRNKLRQQILDVTISRWSKRNYKSVGRLSVGTGKTRIFIEAIKNHISRVSNPNVLILVPTTNLKDYGFIDEVHTWWDIVEFNKYCTIACYQSSLNLGKVSLLILDEADFCLSKGTYQEYVESINPKELLALSGTFDKEKQVIAESLWGKFIIDITLKKAQEINLVNKINIIIYPVPLSTIKNIPNKTGKWSENDKYYFLERKILEARNNWLLALQQANDYKELKLSGDYVDINSINKLIATATKDMKRWYAIKTNLEYKSKFNRVDFLYNLNSNILAAKNLLSENSRSIVFTTRTSTIDAITGDNSYHGKRTKLQLERTINAFNDGTIDYIGASKKVERGINFKNLTTGIFPFYTSSESSTNQKLGRLVRLPIDEIATAHFIHNTYVDYNGNTNYCQNHVWLMKALESIGIEYTINTKFT